MSQKRVTNTKQDHKTAKYFKIEAIIIKSFTI